MQLALDAIDDFNLESLSSDIGASRVDGEGLSPSHSDSDEGIHFTLQSKRMPNINILGKRNPIVNEMIFNRTTVESSLEAIRKNQELLQIHGEKLQIHDNAILCMLRVMQSQSSTIVKHSGDINELQGQVKQICQRLAIPYNSPSLVCLPPVPSICEGKPIENSLDFFEEEASSSSSVDSSPEREELKPVIKMSVSSTPLAPAMMDTIWHKYKLLRLLILLFLEGALFCTIVHGSPCYVLKKDSTYGLLLLLSTVESWIGFLKKRYENFAPDVPTKATNVGNLWKELPPQCKGDWITKNKRDEFRKQTPIKLTQTKMGRILMANALEYWLQKAQQQRNSLLEEFHVEGWIKQVPQLFEEFQKRIVIKEIPGGAKPSKESWCPLRITEQSPYVVPGSWVNRQDFLELTKADNLWGGLELMFKSASFKAVLRRELYFEVPVSMGWLSSPPTSTIKFLTWMDLMAFFLGCPTAQLQRYSENILTNRNVPILIVLGVNNLDKLMLPTALQQASNLWNVDNSDVASPRKRKNIKGTRKTTGKKKKART